MISLLVIQVAATWESLPHPVSRLVYTLLFMVFVLEAHPPSP